MNEPVIPRLLAGRDRLSRVEQDAILAAVLGSVAPRRRARWWLAAGVPIAAAVALVLIAPWKSQPTETEFASRGSSQPFAMVHATCPDGCERGHKIVFDLHGTTGFRYFAAFAKRTDGTVLWYFPALPGETSLDLAVQPGHGVLDRSIVIGEEHVPGRYTLYSVFSRVPLTREAIRTRFDELQQAGAKTQVVTSELVVR